MQTIDIIILITSGLIIVVYTFINVRKFTKQKKYFNECLEKGMSKEQAKAEMHKYFDKNEKLDPTDKEINE